MNLLWVSYGTMYLKAPITPYTMFKVEPQSDERFQLNSQFYVEVSEINNHHWFKAYIIENNKAGPNGECLTWDEIEEMYGANQFHRN